MLFRYDKQIVLPRQFDTDCDVLLAKKKDKQMKQERTDKIKTPQCKNKTTLTLETKY